MNNPFPSTTHRPGQRPPHPTPRFKSTTSSTASDHACIICMDHPKNICLQPCNHAHCCADCFQRLPLNTCPLCRTPITSTLDLVTGLRRPVTSFAKPVTRRQPTAGPYARRNSAYSPHHSPLLSHNSHPSAYPSAYRNAESDRHYPIARQAQPSTRSPTTQHSLIPLPYREQHNPSTTYAHQNIHHSTQSLPLPLPLPLPPLPPPLPHNTVSSIPQRRSQQTISQRRSQQTIPQRRSQQTIPPRRSQQTFFTQSSTTSSTLTECEGQQNNIIACVPNVILPTESIILVGTSRKILIPLARKLITNFPPPKHSPEARAMKSTIFVNGDALRLVLIESQTDTMAMQLAERVERQSPKLVLLCADYSDVGSFESIVRLDMEELEYLHVPTMWIVVRTSSATKSTNTIDEADVRAARHFITTPRQCIIVSVNGSKETATIRKLSSQICRHARRTSHSDSVPSSQMESIPDCEDDFARSPSLLCLCSMFTKDVPKTRKSSNASSLRFSQRLSQRIRSTML